MCIYIFCLKEEEFEGTKGVIRIRNSKKNRQHNGQKKNGTNGQTRIHKNIHIEVKIEKHEPH